jgi:hypothetical protein
MEPVAQMEEVTQRLKDLNKRLFLVALASWLLVLFMALLATRILCWAWMKPAYLTEKKVAWCFLPLDRMVVTSLAILLLYLTGFHVVHDISLLLVEKRGRESFLCSSFNLPSP